MKILIVGRCDGWMGIHLSHFSDGFRHLGHEVILANYHEWDRRDLSWFSIKHLGASRVHRQTEGLRKLLQDSKPQMVLLITAGPIFNLDVIKEFYAGPIIFYDMDGLAWGNYQGGYSWIQDIDLLLSVSKAMVRKLTSSGLDNVHYLPHGVDTDYYHPLTVSYKEYVRFSAPIAFVGRPSERRVRYLEAIADQDLVIWGRRWAKKPLADNRLLSPSVREKGNIIGEDLIKLYRSTSVIVNIMREQFKDLPSIMSLQVFAVPSTGTCLLTEWVEGIGDAFEVEKEILAFRTIEEFREKAALYARDSAKAIRIGEAGRKRCLAQHTHSQRAREILGILGLH